MNTTWLQGRDPWFVAQVALGAPLGVLFFAGSAKHIASLAEAVNIRGIWTVPIVGTIELLMAYTGLELRGRKDHQQWVCQAVILLGAFAVLGANYFAADLPSDASSAAVNPIVKHAIYMAPAVAFLCWLLVLETRPVQKKPKIQRPVERLDEVRQARAVARPAEEKPAKQLAPQLLEAGAKAAAALRQRNIPITKRSLMDEIKGMGIPVGDRTVMALQKQLEVA